MTQFSLGFEFEDTYWNGKFINELKYNGIPVAAGAAKTAQRVAPFAICTNSNREHLWYLSLDGDHVELITAPIYSNKNPLEKIQQIKNSIEVFLFFYRKNNTSICFTEKTPFIKLTDDYILNSNGYLGELNFNLKDGAKSLLYPQFTVNLPKDKVFTFFKKYFGNKNENLRFSCDHKRYQKYFATVDSLIKKSPSNELFYLSYILNVLINCDPNQFSVGGSGLKYMFLLLPRTCVSSTISTSSTTSKSSALLTKELNYLTLYKQFIEECDLEEIPYLRLASGLQPGTKDFFAKELSWYKYIADLMNRKHLSLNTSEINQEQAELSIKDFIDLKKKQKKQNTPHFIAIPNDQEYYNSKIKSLNNLEIQEEYIKKYNQRDVLSPPPFIEYHDFSSTGLCTFGEFDEGCIALEARNNTTDPFGINDIQHWRQLDRIKEIYNRIAGWLSDEGKLPDINLKQNIFPQILKHTQQIVKR